MELVCYLIVIHLIGGILAFGRANAEYVPYDKGDEWFNNLVIWICCVMSWLYLLPSCYFYIRGDKISKLFKFKT